jgi:hypothetical protein
LDNADTRLVSPTKTSEFDSDEFLNFPQTAMTAGFPHHQSERVSSGHKEVDSSKADRAKWTMERHKAEGICTTSGGVAIKVGAKRKRIPTGMYGLVSGEFRD